MIRHSTLVNIFSCLGFITTGYADVTEVTDYVRHRYACNSPRSCGTNSYSIECPVGEKIAINGVYYGAKPYTYACQDNQSCVRKSRCCEYQTGDCLVSYNTTALYRIYSKCSQGEQCGWLFASSIDVTDKCEVGRKESNYVKTNFQCFNDVTFMDICSQHTMTGRVINLHHSAIASTIYTYNQCTCVITPDNCNTSATLRFRTVDIRLHSKVNSSLCAADSRIELIGQRERKMYGCQSGEFLYGMGDFHVSQENGMVLYLHKKTAVYPTKVWIQVEATLPGVGVTVTCGPRSIQTAPRCPALPTSASQTNQIDEVDHVPWRETNKPTIIELRPEIDNDTNYKPGNKQDENPALFAIIGGVAAGVVVLILLLVIVCCILCRKRKARKNTQDSMGKYSLPQDEPPTQVGNYYESVSDPDLLSDLNRAATNIYHQPWGKEEGVAVNRANPTDLAYATSEEIKVLIEKMERDRQFLTDGLVEYPAPDPTYYRRIDDYQFKPSETEPQEGDSDIDGEVKDDSETESKSVTSENCETGKLESEDSKAEADRGIDCVESLLAESESASVYYDGYESPRVSSFIPSNSSGSVRDSLKSDLTDMAPCRFASQTENIIYEDTGGSHSDLDNDVPSEHAPSHPIGCESGYQTDQSHETPSASNSHHPTPQPRVTLGGYREPMGSFGKPKGEDSLRDGNQYTSVYDKITEGETKM